MSEVLNNVNFQILLKQHGGNMARATEAWERICSLGGFGAVPASYEGGVDVGSIRSRLADDARYKVEFQAPRPGMPNATHIPVSPTLSDDLKRIEDIASGDRVK